MGKGDVGQEQVVVLPSLDFFYIKAIAFLVSPAHACVELLMQIVQNRYHKSIEVSPASRQHIPRSDRDRIAFNETNPNYYS